MELVGAIYYRDAEVEVYGSLDKPWFLVTDIAKAIDYGVSKAHQLIEHVEPFEQLLAKVDRSGQKREMWFVTESGLYNILAQSRKPIARTWRQVIFQELIKLRQERGMNVEEWFAYLDASTDIFYDETANNDKGQWFMSITVEGGDVEQIPYEPETIRSDYVGGGENNLTS